ncbi:unnamed protein product, partial [Choristocarpus tenellus]
MCPSLTTLRAHASVRQHNAAVKIQACARGVLGRRRAAVLRAEMRVFGALQVLVDELRRPELEDAGSDPFRSLATILTEHAGGKKSATNRLAVFNNQQSVPHR